jgi:response regulator RpfG family c-di-GMP phosphodiesterase
LAEAADLAPVRVLFVDDEENILKALVRIFVDEPFELLTATSGEAGLRILEETPDVALIVSDQRMPGMGGAEFLEKARAVAPDALRIILTGYADVHAAVDAINRGGAYRYLAKPWDEEALLAAIREAVDKYRLLQENRRLQDIVRKQNDELKEWNQNLNRRVLDQTRQLREQYEAVRLANQRLEASLGDTIDAFSELVGLRDEGMRNHSHNVAEIALRIAKAMPLPPKEIETIGTAALLHDIGKIGIPDTVLRKDRINMTPEERRIYAQHPVRGQTAIDRIERLRGAGTLVRHHHEWWNGRGFPDGIQGGAIPVGARILCVADALDRAFAELPGDEGLLRAMHKIRMGFGSQFDPALQPHLERAAPEVYGKGLFGSDAAVRELQIEELQPGMIVGREVHSGTGILLLREGTQLDAASIEALARYSRLDPGAKGVFILVPGD